MTWGVSGAVVAFPGVGVGLKLSVARGHPSKCRGLRAIFCPITLRSTLRVEAGPRTRRGFALRRRKVRVTNGPRGGLMMGTCLLLSGRFRLPPIRVRLCGRVPSKTKLKNNSSSTTFVLGLLGRRCGLRLSSGRLRSCTTALKTSYTFFVGGAPACTRNVKGVFSPVRLSLGNCQVVVIGPSIFMSAQRTFTGVHPRHPRCPIERIVHHPITR